MSIVISVEDTGVCRKQVTVEVPAEAVANETDKVARKYASQVQMPGFRKGKVPREVILKRFREEIENEVLDTLVPRYWERARDEESLQPITQPQLEDVGEILAGAPLRFVASVEVRPEVEIGDLPDLDLPEMETEPGAEEVDDAIDELRRQVGDWTEVDRAAVRGDQVTARIEEITDDEDGDDDEEAADAAAPEAGEETAADAGDGSEIVEIEVGDPNVWEELSLTVTGLAAGQEGRFTRRPEGGEGTPRTFRVQVESVAERELPPLDDELARKLGDFESVDALREAMTEKLRHDKRAERTRQRREAALEQMRQHYPLAIPDGVVREEQQRALRRYAEDLARQGIDPAQVNLDWDGMAEQIRPRAEQEVHDRLLLEALAEEREIEVDDAEVASAMGNIARAQGATVDQVRQALGGNVEGLRRQIREEKALQHLLGDDAPEESEEAEAAEAAAGTSAEQESAAEAETVTETEES